MTLAQECVKSERRLISLVQQHGSDLDPASLGMDGPIDSVIDALVVVQLVGAAEVTASAEDYIDALRSMIFDRGSSVDNALAARAYREALRRDLDIEPSQSTVDPQVRR